VRREISGFAGAALTLPLCVAVFPAGLSPLGMPLILVVIVSVLSYFSGWRAAALFASLALIAGEVAGLPAKPVDRAGVALAATVPVLLIERMRRRGQALEDTLDSSGEVIYATDRRARFSLVNCAATRLMGRTRESVVGLTAEEAGLPAELRPLFDPGESGGPGRSTEVVVDPEKRIRVFQTARTALRDRRGDVRGVLGIARDISAGLEYSQPAPSSVQHDPLTGLPNRRFITELTSLALQQGHDAAVLWIGLDRFKVPNDALGHAAGDAILIEAARRLVGCLRSRGSAARIGGDEFVILIESAGAGDEARRTGERVLEELGRSFHVDGFELRLSAGIGLARASAGAGTDARRLLANAAIAMRRAKAAGAGSICEFDTPMRDDADRRLSLEVELRRALAGGELAVFFQPILSLRERDIRGFEALLRWRHPERGLLPPAEFLPAAEETRLIVPIGWFMIRQSLAWTANLNESLGHRGMTISLNLSEIQFAQPDLLQTLRGAVGEAAVDPAQICLELTESVVAAPSPAFLSTVVELKRAGFRVAVDDFGVGYSSLSRIHRIPVDTLKIDREFVRRMHQGENDFAMVKTIVGLAGGLKMQSIAEGIETEQQADTLRELGCAFGQGFLFGRPAEPEKAMAMAVGGAA